MGTARQRPPMIRSLLSVDFSDADDALVLDVRAMSGAKHSAMADRIRAPSVVRDPSDDVRLQIESHRFR
jgi:hypothetical protein